MPQNTDLNVAPYYDDFDKDDNFVRTLFRPGFAIQARELTQLQSTLQNQIEQGFSHMFKDGTVVIPGASSYQGNSKAARYVRLQSSFGGESVDHTQYVDVENPVIITGATSGVKFMVTASTAATTTDPVTLFGSYISSNLAGTKTVENTFEALDSLVRQGPLDADGYDKFVINENISANVPITHGSTTFAADAASITTVILETDKTDNVVDGSTGPVAGRACMASISAGIYFVRGQFVNVDDQKIILDKYRGGIGLNVKIGLRIDESIITPELDTSLLDNATGSSNFAAKGAHRLKFTLTLISIATDSTDDKNFIELLRIKDGSIIRHARNTEYSILEETLARRTFDESGNYTVRPFTFQVKESVDASVGPVDYKGVYKPGTITDSNGIASESLLALQISSGKAYVKGFEIEKIAPTVIDLKKSREFNTVNSSNTAFDVGNYVTVNNLFGTPDVSFISGESTPFKQLSLYDTATSAPGTATGTKIGVARVRTYQHHSGTPGQPDAIYRLFVFDVRPFVRITLSGTPSPTLVSVAANGGQLVTGSTSGATGFIFGEETTGAALVLTNVNGIFQVGEKIISSDSAEAGGLVENSSNADLTIVSFQSKAFDQVRSVVCDDADAGQDFTADIALTAVATASSFLDLDGTTDVGLNNGDNILTEVEGDPIALQTAAAGGTGSLKFICKLEDAEKNISLFRLAKRPVKTLLTATNAGESDTQFTIRRQFIVNTNSSGAVTISAGTNETFLSHSETDYTISVLIAGSGSSKAGDVVSASTGFSGAGTGTLTITNPIVFGTGAKLKIMTTLSKSSVIQKTKTTKLMKQVKVVPGATAAYGTRPTDRQISLGRSDVFRLMAVFESGASDTDAVTPTISLGTTTGTFTRGEKITGASTNATARIITTTSPVQLVYTSGSSKKFAVNEIITAESSGATSTVGSVTEGDSVATSNYQLDTGQRDNYYDISRIERRSGLPAPTGRLLIVFDYLEHSAGDVLTVDSYSDVANQMDYIDIPQYSATKVDPEAPVPVGFYKLYNTFDFRPSVEDAVGATSVVETIDAITGYSFDFFHRQYDGTGASANNFLKPGSLVQADYEYYLGKRAIIELDIGGNITVTEGDSSENPQIPEGRASTMKLAELYIPPFTFTPRDVSIRREKNQRFTMKDIGKLQDRIGNLEYYTHLSLLERDAESFEVTDANGLNRFKSGFVVDAFQGHRLGDVKHQDYQCSIDMESNELRPASKTKSFSIIEQAVSDTERANFGYQKTGDCITLPYTEVTVIEQPFATRVERVTPVLISHWEGHIALNPQSDDWFETEIAPDLIVNVEGNFDTFYESNKDSIGTVWNAWQTQWSGTTASSSSSWWSGRNLTSRTVSTVRTDQTRTGIKTDVIEKIDLESQGTKVIARAMLPFCRPKIINFEGSEFLPNTQLYPFFDKVDVSSLTKPSEGFSTSDSSLIFGDAIITSAAGRVKGVFNLPDPKVSGNLQFRTGELSFRLTASPTNITSTDPITAGETIYYATGILETEQETIIATRNAELVKNAASDSTSIFSDVISQSTSFIPPPSPPRPAPVDNDNENDDDDDPLAQTFIIEESGGAFISSIDLFFSEKDPLMTCTVELRNVVNGYPGPKIMPFGRVVKDPVDISLDETGQTATNFKFDSPVYLQSGLEYCFCVLAMVPTHKIWIARMGETEIQSTLAAAGVGGTGTSTSNALFAERTVSKQPDIGVMFKSHNNRTWAPSLMEDIKFKMNRCSFTALDGTVPLVNDQLPVPERSGISTGLSGGNESSVRLPINPMIFQDGSNVIQVLHPNHNMNTTNNNVRFMDIKSGATTTLANAIDDATTTIVLADGTNFNDTTGKYSRDASNNWMIKINNEIIQYSSISGNTISGATRGFGSNQAGASGANHAAGSPVELYQLHKIPFTEINHYDTSADNISANKTFTSISNINIDSYTITVVTNAYIDGTGTTRAQSGGDDAYASENMLYDLAQMNVSNMQLTGTSITTVKQGTSATSASGVQASFVKDSISNATPIPLNENVYYDSPYMIASGINETNELAGQKSLTLTCSLSSVQENLSPVIDTQRMTGLAVSNRINNVDSASDVYPTDEYRASTEAVGDNNVAIYCTRKASLAQSATALKVFFSANRDTDSEIKVMFKILRSDDASDFDELNWKYFNGDGSPDTATNPSLGRDDFQEYLFTAGVTDDGVGDALDDFISFSIKIVMQSTNSSEPPRIKDFRALALAT
tara:strand:- start:1557 stop:8246 length:6690 start_codon:yes stop_codon:yes gene_type:complete